MSSVDVLELLRVLADEFDRRFQTQPGPDWHYHFLAASVRDIARDEREWLARHPQPSLFDAPSEPSWLPVGPSGVVA